MADEGKLTKAQILPMIHEKEIHAACTPLVEQGFLVKTSDGYRITEAGRAALKAVKL